MATVCRKKIVVVGDGNTGKTCILIVYKDDEFEERYLPTVFESYVVSLHVTGTKVDLTLVDTAGQEEYDRLRPLTYPNTDAVIAVFSIADPTSLENIKNKWLPEIKHYLPTAPILLVGNKTDLRGDSKTLNDLKKRETKPVTHEEGLQMAHKIGAQYLECSAKQNQGVKDVILAATVNSMHVPKSVKRGRCRLL